MSGVPPGVSIRSGAFLATQLPPEVILEGESVADIPAGSITATELANKAVTLAKMNDLAQDKIIGRSTASTGVPEVITCTSFGRSFLAKSAAVTVTGARDEPEAALASLLTQLATLGIITDSTTAS